MAVDLVGDLDALVPKPPGDLGERKPASQAMRRVLAQHTPSPDPDRARPSRERGIAYRFAGSARGAYSARGAT